MLSLFINVTLSSPSYEALYLIHIDDVEMLLYSIKKNSAVSFNSWPVDRDYDRSLYTIRYTEIILRKIIRNKKGMWMV